MLAVPTGPRLPITPYQTKSKHRKSKMNPTAKGKIGRLPRPLQEEVNRRMENNEPGRAIVAWLNSLPAVKALTARQFKGLPISEQNLSSWRRHGYKAWLWHREAVAQTLTERAAGRGAVSVREQAADWASVHYLRAVRQFLDQQAQGQPPFKLLREFLRDIVALRRSDYNRGRLRLEALRFAIHENRLPPAQ
jgi:hypothetical protein